MYIIGAGVAYPETKITDGLLSELRGGKPARLPFPTSIKSRDSILGLEYLRSTQNQDPKSGVATLVSTPTQLVERAARQALERAGISAEKISLVVGEATSPLQTTPSEGQRLANALNIKVPAFDVAVGGNGIALQLHVLSQWEPEVVPDYTLLVSVSTPTQQLDYAHDAAGTYLGDVAVAWVVSPRDCRGLRVKSINFEPIFEPATFVAESYGKISADLSRHASIVKDYTATRIRDLTTQENFNSARAFFAPTALEPERMVELAVQAGFAKESVLESTTEHGFSLGSGVLGAIAENWERYTKGTQIGFLAIGSGTSLATGILERE